MITYLYWAVILGLMIAVLFFVGAKMDKWKPAAIGSLVVLIIGFVAYYFHFQQIFVKRYGGVMSITIPDGQHHIAATWKDDNLWIENYDPATNTCFFNEYSRGNLLQGKVVLKNCNPLIPQQTESPSPPGKVNSAELLLDYLWLLPLCKPCWDCVSSPMRSYSAMTCAPNRRMIAAASRLTRMTIAAAKAP